MSKNFLCQKSFGQRVAMADLAKGWIRHWYFAPFRFVPLRRFRLMTLSPWLCKCFPIDLTMRNRPAAQPTSIGNESLRAVGTSTAKVRSCLQRHPGEASLATYSTENNLQTLSHRLQVPLRRGPCIPLLDVDAFVRRSASSPAPLGHAHGKLRIPRTRKRTFGPRSFSISRPSSWNLLPANLKNIELTLQFFKSQLKTHLFHQAYMDNNSIWD